MTLALAAATLSLLAPAQEPTVFTERFLGLQFAHPPAWKVAKTTKDGTIFSIPVQGSSEPAELHVMRDRYHADRDLYQIVQLRINEQMKREVVRQWEQDILGVPMLFTRINYVDKGVPRAVLMGLFYTRTPLKLSLRLITRQDDYDNVSYELLKALETLRTTDGKAPVMDDPAVKLDAAPKKPVAVPPPPKVLDSGEKTAVAVKPTQTAELTISLRKVNLRYPDGWTVTQSVDNKISLKHPEMQQPLTFELFTTLDSDPPQRALFKASSKSLSQFLQVVSRDDKAAAVNKAGATITSVWRTGKAESGELASYEAVGASGDYYFLVAHKQTDMPTYRTERKLIEALVDLLTIEPAP
jgi:hypothetical protein